ncbi:MAG TPA: hypothetical protein VF939_01200 [Puia sp.]
MKKLISVFIVLGWLVLPGIAQSGGGQPGGSQQRQPGSVLEAMKAAFITKRLNLSPEEAQLFWPIYNQYATEIRQAHVAYREHKNEITLEESILNIKKRYSVEFSKALSPDKVNQFFRAEKDFGAFVQKEMQRRQTQPRPFGSGQ